MQCPFKKKVCCNWVFNSDSNSKHKNPIFSYPSPKSGSGDCSIREVCKNKNNFSAQKQSIFLILMHQGAKVSIPKSQSLPYADK